MVNKVLASLSALFTLDSKGFEAGINKSKKTASSFQKSISGVGLAIAGAFSVGAIVNFTKEAVKLYAEVEGVRKAFLRLGHPAMLNELRDAVKGTVSDLTLMRNTVMAANFNIPIEKMGILLEFAAKRAADTGQSVDYLVESIITGLGRQSVLILDNLGLSAKEISEEAKNTGDFFQAAFKIIERESGKTTMDLESIAVGLQQVQAEAENLKATWGKVVANMKLVFVSSGITKELKGFAMLLEGISLFGVQTPKRMAELLTQRNWGFENAAKMATNQMEWFGKTIEEAAQYLIPIYKARLEEAKKGLDNFNNSTIEASDTMGKKHWQQQMAYATGALEYLTSAAQSTTSAIDEQTESVQKLSSAYADLANARRTRFATEGKETGGTGGAGGTGGVSGAMDFGLTPEAMEGYGDNLDEMVEMTRKAADNINYAFESIGYAFADALAEFMKGQKSFSDVVFDLIADIIKIIAGFLAQSVAASFAGGASVGGPAAPFTGAAAAATAASLFGAIVPALMASGGTVPDGFPNDTYPAMLSSRETVLPAPIPLSGSTGGGHVDFVIRGENLYGILKKQTSKESRYK